MNNKIYISGALMAATNIDKAKKLYGFIGDICLENGLFPYLPHNNTDPTRNIDISDSEVFLKDYQEMMTSCLVISYIGEPSLGVGAELAICIKKRMPIIAISERDRKVSRFLKGMLKTSDSTTFIEYDDWVDLKQKLDQILLNCIPSIEIPTNLQPL